MADLRPYDVVVVVEGPRVYRCEVTKVARRYVTVTGSSRSWQFDKETRSHRGDHGGHIPNLYTPREHERLVAWDDFVREFRSLPYSCPKAATLSDLEALTATMRKWATPPKTPAAESTGGR